MSLKIVVIVYACIFLSSQFLLKKAEQMHLTAGFQNYTGTGATAVELSWFTNYINSAAIFYRDDTANRLKYISDQMNNTYGTSAYGFSIIQNAAGILDGYYIYTLNQEYASVQGVDKIYPNNSYLFAKQIALPKTSLINLFNLGQRGYGMTNAFETIIKNIVNYVEDASHFSHGCDEEDLRQMSDLIKEFQDGFWSIICAYQPKIKASVLMYDGLATYINSKRYFYVIWSNDSKM